MSSPSEILIHYIEMCVGNLSWDSQQEITNAVEAIINEAVQRACNEMKPKEKPQQGTSRVELTTLDGSKRRWTYLKGKINDLLRDHRFEKAFSMILQMIIQLDMEIDSASITFVEAGTTKKTLKIDVER